MLGCACLGFSIRILGLVIGRLIGDFDAAVFDGVCREIGEFVDLNGLCFFQEPAEVVPKERGVPDVDGPDVGEFMDGHEGDDVLIHEFLFFVALAEAHVDLFALVHGVRGVGGIGRGLGKAGGIGIEITGHLRYEGLEVLG